MSNTGLLLSVVGLRDSSEELHECRDCGYRVEPDVGKCPMCGSEEIAVYEFE